MGALDLAGVSLSEAGPGVWLRVEPLICPSVRAALFWEVSANLGISETARI